MKKLLLLSAALFFPAGLAQASITAEQLVAAYQAKGYSAIEVTSAPNQIKVEAVSGSTRVEVIYDSTTGAILTQKQRLALLGAAGHAVEVKTTADDFLTGTEDDSPDGIESSSDDDTASEAEDGSSGDDHGTDMNDDQGGAQDSGGHSGSDGSESDGSDD